jgi:hypothetical protein
MAWFRPARNKDHPGDPPPKWAPMGKVGRWVLVVTVIVGIVVALAISVTRTSDAAACLDGRVSTRDTMLWPSFARRDEVPGTGAGFMSSVRGEGFASKPAVSSTNAELRGHLQAGSRERCS